MAESNNKVKDSTEVDSDSSPGIGMRLAIAGIKQKFPSVKNLSTRALATLMKSIPSSASTPTDSLTKDKLLLLDSRPNEEFNVGHIPGAKQVDYNADINQLLSAVPELESPDEGLTVVCYCSVGYRSSMVAEKISHYLTKKDSAGKDSLKVYNLEGSIFKWANENRLMIDGDGRSTKYTHPYNAVFGKLLNKEFRSTTAKI